MLCKWENGSKTIEYGSDQKVVTVPDCRMVSTVAPIDYSNAMPTSKAISGVVYGNGDLAVYTCVMKYHKHTGYNIWDNDMPPVASLLSLSDDQPMIIVGCYYFD